ncbi:hypothetical protein M8Z33_38955 [Streptomyces sp. ZAF1911]|uniref:hypothetical protein n=1 Tax=Streptomyces sp. ZAF1911 TaxID=2944129 RepID=UPI00237A2EF3|nr:hypothetical protein [Streptomyces sp. ZAF1911]MDD9382519.1 hypothetical protein [Streptomyces sp. ZAF1911]
MLDTSPLTAAVERFADRLRAAPQSRLQQGAAEVALDLARELSLRAQTLEAASAGVVDGAGAAPARTMPDAGIFVVGDQLAVAGLDLAEALHAAVAGPAGAPGPDPGPDTAKAPSEVLDEAVRLVDQAEARALR